MKEILNKIAHNLLTLINDDWSKITFQIEAYSDYVKTNGNYVLPNNKNVNIEVSKLPFETNLLIWDLLKYTKDNNYTPWNRAVFSITSDGKFDIEYIWDQELDDEIQRNS